jgi:hypothetical protein
MTGFRRVTEFGALRTRPSDKTIRPVGSPSGALRALCACKLKYCWQLSSKATPCSVLLSATRNDSRTNDPSSGSTRIASFLSRALREGYIEGRNVTVERRYSVSRPSNEIGRESRPDIVGDHLRRAELSIPQSAQTGESLLLAWDVVRHAGEGLAAWGPRRGITLGQDSLPASKGLRQVLSFSQQSSD